MSRPGTEGVIKFELEHRDGPPPAAELLGELNAWRLIYRQLGLLGADSARYDGLGFGNLSRRLPGRKDNAFLVSGTQTGHLAHLRPEHYATVLHCDPATNRLVATGRIRPSSEALSHGILYNGVPQVAWVAHLHAPDIFACSRDLGLPETCPDAGHGTPEMAEEIARIAAARNPADAALLVMAGHADGILAYGCTAAAVGSLVVTTLAEALWFANRKH